MTILGGSLIIVGSLILIWTFGNDRKRRIDKPQFFYRKIRVILAYVIGLGSLFIGSYLIWRVSKLLLLIIIAIIAIVGVTTNIKNSIQIRARKLFSILKQKLESYRNENERELWIQSTGDYLESAGKDKEEIKYALSLIFDEKDCTGEHDLIDTVCSMFLILNPGAAEKMPYDFRKVIKQDEKRKRAIRRAYKQVFGTTYKESNTT